MNSRIVKENDVVKILNCITKEEMKVKIVPCYTKVHYSTSRENRFIKSIYKEITSDGDGVNSISVSSLLGRNVIGKRVGQEFRYKDNEGNQEIFKLIAINDNGKWVESSYKEDQTGSTFDRDKYLEINTSDSQMNHETTLLNNNQYFINVDKSDYELRNVDVYIVIKFQNRSKAEGFFYIVDEKTGIRKNSDKNVSYNKSDIPIIKSLLLNEALKCFFKPCNLTIHVEPDQIIRGIINTNKYLQHNYRDQKLTQTILNRLSMHNYRFYKS